MTPAHPAGREAWCRLEVKPITPVHLAESLGALDLTLSQADLAGIDDIMAAAVPVSGPAPEGMS